MKLELVCAALFEHLTARTPSFVTRSRKLVHWTEVPDANLPALFFAQGSVTQRQPFKGTPYVWELSAQVYVYARSESVDVAPAQLLNRLLEEVIQALGLDSTQNQTLGLDYVDTIRIADAIETDDGMLGDLAVAIIPLKIIITA